MIAPLLIFKVSNRSKPLPFLFAILFGTGLVIVTGLRFKPANNGFVIAAVLEVPVWPPWDVLLILRPPNRSVFPAEPVEVFNY